MIFTIIRGITATAPALAFAMTMLVITSCPVNAADGQVLFGQRSCITCHGPEGNVPIRSAYPKLAGQSKDYLVQQTTDIQSGARNNGLTQAV
ncbi:MAG: c-type cytochrome [Gammaproteobacteria bacterium]|nr:c-type cytochrome [Gammaproteobacteria bacterium]MDH3468018.1 c-type cytochrome [Gammaproteobacteria bacterium]